MENSLILHLKRHMDRNKRIKPSFFFDDEGRLHDVLRPLFDNNPEAGFPIFVLPYLVPCKTTIDDNDNWKALVTWLRKNCKHGWAPWIDCISFFDQGDAALFTLWKDVLCQPSDSI